MKKYIFLTLFLSILFFSCQKINPEIAGIDELSSINYPEKIFTQAVQINNQMITVINDGSSSFLTSYNADGSKVWSNNIDEHIITGNSFQDIAFIETKLNATGNIMLNMFDNTQTYKTVTFSSSGAYINEFNGAINQADTLFNGNDTIALNSVSHFIANGIFPLSNGSSAVISAWAPNYINKLTDTTIVQLSIYNNSTQFVDNRYIFIDATVNIKNIFVSSTDDIIFILENSDEETYIYITDQQGNEMGLSNPLPLSELYSFFENSKGEYIFSASSFNSTTDLIGFLFSMNRQGQVLWAKQYLNKSAWIFTSMVEMSDGYMFTGFNINKVKVLLSIDWRSTFDAENVKAILLKTDFLGAAIFQNVLQNVESTVGASILVNENITLLGGKYDRSIHSTMIIKLDQELKLIN